MKKTAVALIISLILIPVFAQDQPTGLRRFAIFAGSNDGGQERVELEYAETDAMAMYEVLSEIGGLAPEDTIIMADPNALEISAAFDKMKNLINDRSSTSRRTEFFFYYSGHSDEQGILPGGELFGYAELRNQIDSMDTDVKIAVLDSCSSGSFTRLKGGTKRAPFMVDESVDTTGHAFLTSSSENEAAQESDSIEGSFFTHYLISALRGAADSTQDGTVTLNEAYSFAADETLARTTSSIAGAQHPSYSINLTGSGDLVLTDLREIVSSIAIDKEIDGRIFFRDSSDRLVIEFRKRAGIPVALSLPSGVYKVDLETEKGLSKAVITVSRGEVALSSSDFASAQRTFARSRGDMEATAEQGLSEDELVEAELEDRMAEIRADINERFSDDSFDEDFDSVIDEEMESVEESLEQKMEEIRSIINDKFAIDDKRDNSDESTSDEPSRDDIDRTDLEYTVFGISPTPSRASSNEVRNISINFIGKPYAIHGAAVGFMNMTYGDVYGAQIAGLSNQTGRDHYGATISGIYNIVDRDLIGFASAGIFNMTEGTVYGMQTAGIFNMSSYKLLGMQAAGIFNMTENYAYGIQTAGIFNITKGLMSGIQVSGIFNISGGQFNGLQTAGIFNVADNINGVQIGLVNVGGVVNGMQVGLININDDINGLPIGLITISRDGIMDFGGWFENSGFFYTGIQTGSKNFYNFAYVAFPTENQGSILVAGMGIGARINLGPFYFDLDTSIKSVADGTDYMDAVRSTFSAGHINSLYPNARISAGLKMFNVLTLYGGMSLDVHIPGYTTRSEYFHNYDDPWIIKSPETGSDVVEFHPKWFGGLKINL